MDSIIPISNVKTGSALQGDSHNRQNQFPAALQDIIKEMDEHAQLLKEEKKIPGSWESVWDSKYNLWECILNAESKGIISPKEKVLELGSGNGSALIAWAYRGYDITGIEIDPVLAAYSVEALSRHRSMLANPNARIIQGSYYPEEYIKYRKTNPRSKAITHEKKYAKSFASSTGKYFILECEQDVYAKNNISLKDFDIFYAYLWKFQVPSVVEVFKTYARKDAKLFLLGPDIEEVPLLGLKQHTKPCPFYIKK